jgi:hypothetical protein
MPHETVRHHVEEMPTTVSDFRRLCPCANLLGAPLDTVSALLPVEFWRCGLRHQIPAQGIRCGGIGVAGGTRSVSLR